MAASARASDQRLSTTGDDRVRSISQLSPHGWETDRSSLKTMELYFTPHFEIPITYTTGSNAEISCMCAIRVESTSGADVEPLVTWIQQHDWTKFGETVFADAVANPYIPDPEDADEWSQQDLDTTSMSQAMQRSIMRELPQDLIPVNFMMHTSSTCQGILR